MIRNAFSCNRILSKSAKYNPIYLFDHPRNAEIAYHEFEWSKTIKDINVSEIKEARFTKNVREIIIGKS